MDSAWFRSIARNRPGASRSRRCQRRRRGTAAVTRSRNGAGQRRGKAAVAARRAAVARGRRAAALRRVLELEEGPERIESGWWDGRDVRAITTSRAIRPVCGFGCSASGSRPGAGSCMASSAELPDDRRADELRGTALSDEFQLPAGRLASGRAGRARGGARLCGARDHGRVLGGRRGACPRGGTRAFAATDRRQRVSPRGRITTRAARDQPRRLWPALPADHPGATRGNQGQLPSHA